MPEEQSPRKVHITKPGASGSFARPKTEIESDIRADRAQSEMERAQNDAEDRKVEEEEKKRTDEIDRLLPSSVMSTHGEISYNLFKEIYGDIWKQIKEKEHLSIGYCSYTDEVFEGVEVTIRTFTSLEAKTLFRWAPDVTPGQSIDQSQDSQFRFLRLVVGLVMFDGRLLQSVPDLSAEGYQGPNIEKWLDDDMVKQKLAWLGRLPDEVIFFLGGIQADITNAYRYALRENLKNRLAPPSHS